jgi:hypothetical protein
MKIPDVLIQIADDIKAGRSRRAKVRTLMGWYGLKKRREAGISVIRGHLVELGLQTIPDFESADFDGQVHFGLAGQTHSSEASENADAVAFKSYQIEEEPGVGGQRRFRLLLRTYDSFERLRDRIVGNRLAQVHFSGQNARREDRDTFPFALSVGLTSGHTPEKLEEWVENACSLEQTNDVLLPIVAASTPEEATPLEELRDHVSDLGASLRVSLSEEVEKIRESVERKVDEIRFDAVLQLAKELNNEEALRIVEEFEKEYKTKLEERERELKAAYAELQVAYERLEDQTADLEEPNPGDAYSTMVGTVRLFSDLCVGAPITVADAAFKSASKSGCTRRREVLLLLMTIRDLAEALFKRGGTGGPLREWFADRGYGYAQGDSRTTSSKFGSEREVTIRDLRVQLEEHVTLFENTDQCVSVYWWRDDGQRQLVVGYVGPHLRTVSR